MSTTTTTTTTASTTATLAAKPTPLWRRRQLWEPVTQALIALGLLMLMQPFWLALYSYSFSVLLLGVLGFSVAGKLPAN